MAFIRLKRVAKDRYAYLVDTVWTAKGPRQKVKRYLGKYIELPDAAAEPLTAPLTAGALIASELRARGFSNTLVHEELRVRVNLKTCTAKQGTKNVVLGLNGGFLCAPSIRKLVHFVPVVEVTPGYTLARAFSDAGVRVSREQFVALYTKAYKRAST